MTGPLFGNEPDPLQGWAEVPCPSCSKPIIWAEIIKADGHRGRVPLDPKPPVFVVTIDGKGKRAPQKREHAKRVLVSHFVTCSNPPGKK